MWVIMTFQGEKNPITQCNMPSGKQLMHLKLKIIQKLINNINKIHINLWIVFKQPAFSIRGMRTEIYSCLSSAYKLFQILCILKIVLSS